MRSDAAEEEIKINRDVVDLPTVRDKDDRCELRQMPSDVRGAVEHQESTGSVEAAAVGRSSCWQGAAVAASAAATTAAPAVGWRCGWKGAAALAAAAAAAAAAAEGEHCDDIVASSGGVTSITDASTGDQPNE
jgi:hypothetical protein